MLDLNSDMCLICLEKCKNTVTFECCGEYLIHDKCYKKWKDINKICLICRNPILENNNFVLYYVTLSQLKIVLSCYCLFMLASFLYIVIVCDFSKDYCDLM
jgi:hypothetical protein